MTHERDQARQGERSSFILGKPFYWRIVPAVRSVILAGSQPVFEQVQAVTVMRVWVLKYSQRFRRRFMPQAV